MKKCFLFALTALSFTSISYATQKDTALICRDKENGWLSASLYQGTQWGAIAYLGDNYDSARKANPLPNDHHGMDCKEVGNTLECTGTWAFNQAPAKVVFTTDAAGNVSATFERSPFYGAETVTFPCHTLEQLAE